MMERANVTRVIFVREQVLSCGGVLHTHSSLLDHAFVAGVLRVADGHAPRFYLLVLISQRLSRHLACLPGGWGRNLGYIVVTVAREACDTASGLPSVGDHSPRSNVVSVAKRMSWHLPAWCWRSWPSLTCLLFRTSPVWCGIWSSSCRRS